MGFGKKKSDPAPEPRTKPEPGTYAAKEQQDPVNTQLGLNQQPEQTGLLAPKRKQQSMMG